MILCVDTHSTHSTGTTLVRMQIVVCIILVVLNWMIESFVLTGTLGSRRDASTDVGGQGVR